MTSAEQKCCPALEATGPRLCLFCLLLQGIDFGGELDEKQEFKLQWPNNAALVGVHMDSSGKLRWVTQ